MAETLRDFAISRYQREGIASCCLRLQDEMGVDVNMLLAAAWLAEQGRCWSQDEVCKLIARCADWREQCILPLRAVRRYLKGHPLYESVKAFELDAEIHQLHLLQEALQDTPLSSCECGVALRTNLLTYLECIAPHRSAVEIAAALQRLIDTLTP